MPAYLTAHEETLLLSALSELITSFPGYRLDLDWFRLLEVQKELQRIKQYYTDEYVGPSHQHIPLLNLARLISVPEQRVSPICVLLYLIACTDASFLGINDSAHLGKKRLVSAQS